MDIHASWVYYTVIGSIVMYVWLKRHEFVDAGPIEFFGMVALTGPISWFLLAVAIVYLSYLSMMESVRNLKRTITN